MILKKYESGNEIVEAQEERVQKVFPYIPTKERW